MKFAITNCNIFSGEKILHNKAIIVNNNKIEAVVDVDKIPSPIQIFDLNRLNIAPGFIDVQVNGGGGCLFNNNPTRECITKIFEAHKRYGTTNFLPTLFTVSIKKMFQGIDAAKSCLINNECGVLGLHLEGPYINKEKTGVHDKRYIKLPSFNEINSLIKYGKGTIKIFTLAPEIVSKEYIKFLAKNGIIVSAGHTNASYEEIKKSFNWGVSMVTHLFNAMSQFEGRSPGVVGATLESSDIWASIIVDGFHTHFASIRIAKKMKGNKLLLITDAMPPVGSKIKEFQLGDLKVICNNDKCTTKEGILAGSALDMATAVRNCVHKVGIPLDEALRMASTYPAKLLGMDHVLGKIKSGYLANMTIFNNHLSVKGVITNGKYESFE